MDTLPFGFTGMRIPRANNRKGKGALQAKTCKFEQRLKPLSWVESVSSHKVSDERHYFLGTPPGVMLVTRGDCGKGADHLQFGSLSVPTRVAPTEVATILGCLFMALSLPTVAGWLKTL